MIGGAAAPQHQWARRPCNYPLLCHSISAKSTPKLLPLNPAY